MGRGADSGRRREWEERVRRYVESGLSVAEFCEWEGVSAATFYNWRKKLARDHSGRTRSRSIGAAQSGSGLEVSLDRSSFLPVRIRRPFAATTDVPGAALELAGAAMELRRPALELLSPAAQTSRVEIRLANGVSIFVPGADAGLLETVISVVGRLPAVPRCDAGGRDNREEGIAC